MSRRVGSGIKRGWEPSPALVAERLARMNGAQRRTRAERAVALRALVEGASGMRLEELKRAVPTRYWTIALAHLGGYTVAEIARGLGYATSDGVTRVLKHPVVQALVEKVRDAQLERVLQGTYGVAAQARAAAPAVMEHVVELAGARKGTDGARVGRAHRDADALRAAELTLTVSGHKVERQAHLHLHLLEELSEAELERLADTGEWPERYASMARAGPGAPTTLPAPGATSVGAGPGPPDEAPAPGGAAEGIEPHHTTRRRRVGSVGSDRGG